MGRGSSDTNANAAATPARGAAEFKRPEISEFEAEVLDALKGLGEAPVSYMRRLGSSRKLTSTMIELENKGLVQRIFNAYGPQTPWWWRRLPQTPPEHPEIPDPCRGEIFDVVYEEQVYLEVMGRRNEYGLFNVSVRAGEHNSVTIWVPKWFLAAGCEKRRRGTVTAWSAQFFCPVHGECSEEMVTTKKTCSICGSMLNRS
jgi:hypothetical protein